MAWTSPRTWVSGEVPPATTWNTHIRDNLKAIGDPWTAYTPTLTGFTASTNAGKYVLAGKLAHIVVRCVLNAAPTGTMTVGLPTPALSTTGGYTGLVTAGDAGTANYVGAVVLNNTTSVLFIPAPSSGGVFNATTPFTWVSGDTLNFSFTYEAA